MALTNIIRRAASRVIPSAFRATIFITREVAPLLRRSTTRGGALPQKLFSSHNYATKSKSDETLVKVIDFEIQCAEESNDNDKIEDIPESFPFKIEDEPGQQTLTLTREYQGESISREFQEKWSMLGVGVTAFPDEIAIDSLSIKDPKVGEDQIAYEGPDFGDLVTSNL
ncbi:hypothetical protein Leryth_009099 [Lithospermum erythrorhizon]|nr:hypothetical protein Leryth_009099 [Lithospermum erythrorhizon]